MENLQQIVVQETSSPYKRALAQYGNDLSQTNQLEIIYDDLSENEKETYDSFIELIKSKR